MLKEGPSPSLVSTKNPKTNRQKAAPTSPVKLLQKPDKHLDQCPGRSPSLFRRLYRVDEIDVDAPVADVGSHMRRHIPVQGRREQLVGGRQIFTEVSGVVNLPGPDLPGVAEFRRQAVVEAAEFKFAHVIDVTFLHVEANQHGSGSIVKLRIRLDRAGDESTGSVEIGRTSV